MGRRRQGVRIHRRLNMTSDNDQEPLSPTQLDSVLFDLGGVLIDWSPRYLFARHFDGDEAAMDHFLTHVCPSDWNVTMDAGKPADVGLAERVALHPEHEPMIRRWFDEWPAMMKGPVKGVPEILDALKRRRVRLYALTNWSADTFPHAERQFDFFDNRRCHPGVAYQHHGFKVVRQAF